MKAIEIITAEGPVSFIVNEAGEIEFAEVKFEKIPATPDLVDAALKKMGDATKKHIYTGE